MLAERIYLPKHPALASRTPERSLAEALRANTPVRVQSRPQAPKPKPRHRQTRPVSTQRTSHFRPQPDQLNPQSQSLSRSYGSVLPTSLTYIILTTRGCSPWRPAADMGTAIAQDNTILLGFSRADESTLDTARAAVLYGSFLPISG